MFLMNRGDQMDQRRNAPYPSTWEAPTAALVAAAAVMLVGVHIGRGSPAG